MDDIERLGHIRDRHRISFALVSRKATEVQLRILGVSPIGATSGADLGVSSNFIMQHSWVAKWVRFPRQHQSPEG